jgi:hypothetical protein
MTLGVPKKPDLFVQLDSGDPGFFIEVTTLGPSQKERKAHVAFDELWGHSFRLWPLTNCAGRLQRVLAPRHLQEIKQQIQTLVKKAQSETGFETLEIPETLQFAFATEAHEERLRKWAQARGMEAGQLSGPGVNVEEFDRISFKLEKELKQVPLDRANVVVLYSHLFTMPPRDTAAFSQFVLALEDVVYKHAHIGYLVLIFSWTGGSDNAVIRYHDHICVNRCQLYFNCDSMMLIKNRFTAKPMQPAVEEIFLKAFMQI